jgi:4-aminobutyrate aminotransferase/(S)-3-amino-2-methylpropionate transaminase
MRPFPEYKLLNFRKFLSPKQANKLSDSFHNFYNKFVEPYEAMQPEIHTSFPGPKTIEYNAKLSKIIGNNQNLREVINLEKSFGNYFQDLDGNVVLDMHMDNGKNIFGYNYRKWVQHAKMGKYNQYLTQKPSLGYTPPVEYPKMLMELLNKVGPKNLHEVLLTNGSGSAANDAAIKIAMLNKLYDLKGNDNLSKAEIMECFAKRKLSVLGFEGGYHGNYLSTLSVNSTGNPNATLYAGVTTANWPVAPFPKLKYPYNENYDYNISEEKRCIEETANLIKAQLNKNAVAAIIIEPLQLFSGMRYASSIFYRDLLDLCNEYKISFIVDETNTSGWANGRPFMYLNWNLEKTPHFVTFGNRMQIAGVFYQQELRANKHNNPDLSNLLCSSEEDPNKLIQFFQTYEMVYKVDWLDTHCSQFTETVKAELVDMQRKWNVRIENIRGIGKMFGFDVASTTLRDEIVQLSRERGFKINPIGDKTIGFTPSLLFTEIHFARYKEMLLNLNPASANQFCPSMNIL